MSEPFIDAGIFIDYVWNLRAERDTLLAQVATLQSDANSWQSGYDKGRHDGAKHRQDEVKQLAAQVEAMRGLLRKVAPHFAAPPGLGYLYAEIDAALQAKS